MIKKIILSLVSAAISIIFIRAGTFEFSYYEGREQSIWFGIASIVYGAVSVGLLLAAWKSGSRHIERSQRYLSYMFLVLVVAASFDNSMFSGLEVGSWLIAGIMLYASWFSIKSVQTA